MNRLFEEARHEFGERFDGEPAGYARAPGCVNLIGDHTDYNGGFVLPMAIDRCVWIAYRPTDNGHVRVYSVDFEQQVEIPLASGLHKNNSTVLDADPSALPAREHGPSTPPGYATRIRGLTRRRLDAQNRK